MTQASSVTVPVQRVGFDMARSQYALVRREVEANGEQFASFARRALLEAADALRVKRLAREAVS